MLAAAALTLACDREPSGGAARDSTPADTTPDTSVVAARPDPSAWQVTADGYGPVRIDMTVEEVRATLGELLVPRDSISPECDYLAIGPEGPEVLFMIVGGRLVRIDVRDSTVATSQGARIGDSESTVGRLYGSERVMSTPHAYTDGHYLTVAPRGVGDDRRLVFETDGRTVTEYRAGLLPMVGWVEGCS